MDLISLFFSPPQSIMAIIDPAPDLEISMLIIMLVASFIILLLAAREHLGRLEVGREVEFTVVY
jgi:hypothetical protein